ncbi:putative transmembrane protein [Pseudomonas amygdali pv. lachrymans]|nr:putative transmembrane protein [Pseudomonas amygdali pv. lachrymans]
MEFDKAKDLRELDHRLEDKQLTYEQHLREQRTIEQKYSAY